MKKIVALIVVSLLVLSFIEDGVLFKNEKHTEKEDKRCQS